MTTRLLLVMSISLAFASLLLGTAVLAQDEVPPPYAGLKNPFPWSDASVQAAGKALYQLYCLGCHGVTGSGVASSDFSARHYPQRLEDRPDLYYWILSEGSMDKGMPPFKSSISEQARWQVLTYIWSLGKAIAPPPSGPPEGGLLQLNSVRHSEAGQPLIMSAILLDKAGKPIPGVPVRFFTKENFSVTALMAIGDATTDGQGVAVFEYVPRRAGSTELVARYGAIEASAIALVTEADKPFYRVEVGIRLPAAGPKVFIGPRTATEPTEGQAPTTALWLPGGLLSWLWLFVIALVLIWGTYFSVMRQVLRIPPRAAGGLNLRLVPQISLAIVALLGILMALMVITGPYSQFHLPP